MKRSVFLVVGLLVVAGACGDAGEGAAPSTSTSVTTSSSVATSITTTSTTTPSTTTPSTTTPSTAGAPARLSASSRLRIDGIGPLDVGMTVAEARAAAGTELALKKEPYCDVLRAPAGPAGLELIVTTPSTGRIDLVIVHEGPVATLSGIRVGSTEAEVLATYPGRIRVVNPSLPVHRLIYTATDPALADRALVFVVDSGRVATMYAGLRDQAEADEICG